MRIQVGWALILCFFGSLIPCHADDYEDAYTLHKFVDEKYRGMVFSFGG